MTTPDYTQYNPLIGSHPEAATSPRIEEGVTRVQVMRDRMFEKLRYWRGDIVGFVREVFKVEPTDQQKKILKSFEKPGSKTAVRSGHGIGKSSAMAWCAIWMVGLFDDVKAVATAPSAPQLHDVLMAEIEKQLTNANPWFREQFDVSKKRLAVKGRESLQFLTARTARADKPDALQGIHAKHVAIFVDEAFGVEDRVYEAGSGSLSTPGARIMLAGNPTKLNGYAFNAFNRDVHKWNALRFSCLDSPLVSPEFVKNIVDTYGEDSDYYRIRVLGEFPRATVNQLISRELAEAAGRRKLAQHDYYYAPRILGVDVAWEGDDRSTIYLRQGLYARRLFSQRGVDNMTLGGLVDQFWREHNCDACFIDVGWGSGVIDYLRSFGREPTPINFGGVSNDGQYKNKRTQMWCDMKKWLEMGGGFEWNEALIEDMVAPEIYFLATGQKILETKRDMKARGLQSPDEGDGLCLTFAFPVQKLDSRYEIDETTDRIYARDRDQLHMAQKEYEPRI